MISFQIWPKSLLQIIPVSRYISHSKVHRQKNNFAFFLPVHYMGKYVSRQ